MGELAADWGGGNGRSHRGTSPESEREFEEQFGLARAALSSVLGRPIDDALNADEVDWLVTEALIDAHLNLFFFSDAADIPPAVRARFKELLAEYGLGDGVQQPRANRGGGDLNMAGI